MAEPVDTRTGHVPAGLVYGPVRSRRFGLSLGVSLSAPGRTVCRWRCPYCQLGEWPYDEQQPWPPTEDVLHAVRTGIAAVSERPLVVTVAGGGEPTDHPDFAVISHALRAEADRSDVRLLLLSNGDGLEVPERRAALSAYHAYQIKWDPGAQAGAWAPGGMVADARIGLLAALPDLELQSMVFDSPGGGNHDDDTLTRYAADVRRMRPRRIHLGTVDRGPRLPGYRPLSPARLQAIADGIRLAAGVPVSAY
ncbi:MAG: radical SAM protein [Planctomycetota bacterium]